MPFCCWRHGFVSADTGTSSQVKSEEENPFVLEESEDIEEQPLVRHRSRHLTPANVDSADSGQVSYSASGPPQPIDRHPQHNGHVFENDEVGIRTMEYVIILFMNELKSNIIVI